MSEDQPFKKRWMEATPEVGLTWGRWVTGVPFVEKAHKHGIFGGSVLEVGPGYGRLLQAALDTGVPFDRWVGVDLSPENVAALSERFQEATFINADIETVNLEETFDGALSSLTFKHIYPDFSKALANVGRHLKPEGKIAFDLLEGNRSLVEHNRNTFLHYYERDEVERLVHRAGFRVIGFDDVEHEPGWTRLLVVCEVTDRSAPDLRDPRTMELTVPGHSGRI